MKQKGFTLIELMITVVVMAILLTVAVPSFTTVIQNNRLTTQVNDFIGSVKLARAEAIKRNASVSVCGSSNGTSCNSAAWTNGWIVISGSTVIQAHEALSSGNTLTGTGTLTYAGTGLISTGGGTAFALCDSRGASYGKAVTISATGNVSISSTAPSSC